MKNYIIFLILILYIITTSCSNKSQHGLFTLPVVSKADESEEVFENIRLELKFGAGEGIRTLDFNLGTVARYHGEAPFLNF